MDAHLRMYGTTDDQATGRFLGAPGDIDGDERAYVLVTAHRWDQGSDAQVPENSGSFTEQAVNGDHIADPMTGTFRANVIVW